MTPFTILIPGHDVPISCAFSAKDALVGRAGCCTGGEFKGAWQAGLAGEERPDGRFGDVRPVCCGSTSMVEILGLNAVSLTEPIVCRLLRCCASIRDMMLGVMELPVLAVHPPNHVATDSAVEGSESSWLVATGGSCAALNCCNSGEQDLELSVDSATL